MSCSPAARLRRFPARVICLAALCCLGLTHSVAADYTAMFANGDVVQAQKIENWYDSRNLPTIDGKRLFDPDNPVQWVVDNTLPAAPVPPSYVEFFGGDRLPGRVASYATGNENRFQKQTPHLWIEPDVNVDWPTTPRARGVPVSTRWLRRVVWERRSDPRYAPSTLYYRDGRQIEYRSLRWGDGLVRLLTVEGPVEVPWTQIAELHLPLVDNWAAYFDQVAVLSPQGTSTLMQCETVDGLRVLTSSERFQPLTRSGSDPFHWYHLMQPAWALEPLWVRHRTVRARRFFKPDRVPLVMIEPVKTEQKSTLAGAWTVEVNQSVKGTPLRSGSRLYGWGFGVHSTNLIEFELPEVAQGFRGSVGLDASAGSGGCARALVYLGSTERDPAFRSPHLIGSQKVEEIETISLADLRAGNRKLILVADAAQNDRPAGADPLEIRDHVNWLEPVILLDPEQLGVELRRRYAALFPVWNGWQLDDPANPRVQLVQRWDAVDAQSSFYRLEVVPEQSFYAVSRSLTIAEDHKFLVVAASRQERTSAASQLVVQFDNVTVATFDVPVRTVPCDPEIALVPVHEYAGQTVKVRILHVGTSPNSAIEWRTLVLTKRDPTYVELFDENEALAEALNEGAGELRVDTEKPYTGRVMLTVKGDDRQQARIEGWTHAVRAHPAIGEYRYLRFAWKPILGRGGVFHFANDGLWGSERGKEPRTGLKYALGRATKPVGIVYRTDETTDWAIVERDLFADFGDITLTGMGLLPASTESIAIDHIYLARRKSDFARIPLQRTPPSVVNAADAVAEEDRPSIAACSATPAGWHAVVAKAAPGWTLLQTASGAYCFSSWRGKGNVLSTQGIANKPGTLRIALDIPAEKRPRLKFSVTDTNGTRPWTAVVVAHVEGEVETLREQKIENLPKKTPWKDVTVDLARFSGKRILLDLEARDSWGYWHDIRLEGLE